VLIVRIGAMGDVLHALPAVAALRAAQPEWEIDWAVDPRWVPLLVDANGRGPLVDRTLDVPTKEWNRRPFSLATLRSILQLRRVLREARYDIVVDVQGTLRSAVIGWFAGARVFAGYDDPRERLARWFYSRRVRRCGVHVVEQGAALLSAAFGLELSAAAVTFPVDAAAEAWVEQAVERRPMAMLAPGAGWGAKRWPAERFGALAVSLRAMGFDVVVNASREDDALAERVVSASEGAARAVPCSVAQLVALLRRTDLFVGGDSGPMHLAAAMAVPTVALFGPTDPARNGPWGPGRSVVLRDGASTASYKRRDELDPGLAQLSVGTVVEHIQQSLL
jgi:heptosyltransferase-1